MSGEIESKKKYKYNYPAVINPYILFFLTLIGGGLFYLSTLNNSPTFRVEGSRFQLAQSSVFRKLAECNDISDGIECFRKYRSDLQSESKVGISPISRIQLESCLDIVSNNANDLALLLNIQTCFHQADMLDRAVEFNESSGGSSWFVMTAAIISLIIQMFIGIHNIITFMFRNRDFEHFGKNVRKLADNFEILNEKQIELYNTVSSLIGTIKSETRNIQGRLNRGGDIRREIDRLGEVFETINIELHQLKGYLYTSRGGPTAAILPPPKPPLNSLQGECNVSGNYSFAAKTYQESNSKTMTVKQATKLAAATTNDNKKKLDMSPAGVSKTDSLESSQKLCSEENAKNTKSSFDISTPEGRERWKAYIKSNLSDKSSQTKLNTDSPHKKVNNSILQPADANIIQTTANTKNDIVASTVPLRYQDIVKEDSNKKRFKRIFVRGRGWVSLKKLEEEEMMYGSSSYVKLESTE